MQKAFVCVLLWIGLFSRGLVHAQTPKIEQLKRSVKAAISDDQRLDACLQLCTQSHSLNIDTLYYYASLARQEAVKLGNKNKIILADTYLETWLNRKERFDSALLICNRDLQGLSYRNSAEVYEKVLIQKGYILMRSGKHKEAQDLAFRFLQEAEQYNDTTSQIFSKWLIGNVYRNMGQTELALQWFDKAVQTGSKEDREEVKNEFGLYFLMGMMYNWKSVDETPTNLKLELSDSLLSISYLDKSIRDSRRFGNLGVLARSLNVKASVVGNRDHVVMEGEYIQEARHIYEQLHDTLSMLNMVSPMCFYYIDAGQPDKGIKVCLEGLEMVKRGNHFPIFDLYDALAECYKASGNYPKYAETLSTIISTKDSIYKKNSERDLQELNAKYEDQKKENTIIQQKLDLAAKKNTVYVISIILGLVLLGIVFLFRYYAKRQKLQKQNEAVAIAAAEEAERRRISADLHDNIGAYAAAASSTISTIRPTDPETGNTLSILRDNVQEMITQLNDSIWALNKKAIYLTGISDRFKLFVQKLEQSYPQVTILIYEEIQEDRHLSSFQALHLFRILQESLNNALKHSKCQNINIHIQSDTSQLRIVIADDGVGMVSGKSNGNGLPNLKQRARESGWDAQWLSNPQGGTSVVITGD